jgi:hypothetical protein
MNLHQTRITLTRIVATIACLLAIAAYGAFKPQVTRAECTEEGCSCECTYGQGTYTEGACRGGQLCSCIHQMPDPNACNSCSWGDGGKLCSPPLGD